MAGLCTLANVKVALFPTGSTDTTDDAVIQLYIDAVTAEIGEYTSRQFVTDSGATDYYFDVAGNSPSRSLYIPAGVQSVTSLGWAKVSQAATGGSYTTVTAANVLLRPLPVDRRAGFPADTIVVSDLETAFNGFYPGFNTIKANMTCGFATVPADVERCALAMVVRRWQARKGGQTDTIGGAGFGGEVLRFTSPEERSLLDRYVDVTVG